MIRLWEILVDKYLTWRTGWDQEQRIWYAWRDANINHRADTVENMFDKFDHIIEVDHNKWFGYDGIHTYVEPHAQEYLWPQRDLGNNAVYIYARGYRDQWDGRFHLNDFRHEADRVFVATNNDIDAVMIALRYS